MNGYLKKEAIGLDGFGQKTLSAWNSRRCSIDRSMMLQNLTLVITLLYHSLRAHQPGADAVLIARACSFGNREDSRRVAIIVFVWMLPGPSTQALSSPCQNVMADAPLVGAERFNRAREGVAGRPERPNLNHERNTCVRPHLALGWRQFG